MDESTAANFLGLSVPTLQRYRSTGTPKIPYVKFPGKRGPVRYRKSDLIAFIERSIRTCTSQGGNHA
ncbi:helix-turn-helix domain-containing protein [Pseudorhodoplanes sp.]|uniref:helix-turn-helix domain-containing protein n=1 Tax=Pseudorhodoplanes sp. TaxID=1934341 RepID=UPI003D131761